MSLEQLEQESLRRDPEFDALSETRLLIWQEAEKQARRTQEAVRPYMEYHRRFRETRREAFADALAGRAAEWQGRRESFFSTFRRLLLVLRKAQAEVAEAGYMVRRELPEAALLEAGAQALEAELLDLERRWRTSEDQEDLAAESRAPSREQFLAIKASLPPQTWSWEESKPF